MATNFAASCRPDESPRVSLRVQDQHHTRVMSTWGYRHSGTSRSVRSWRDWLPLSTPPSDRRKALSGSVRP